MNIMKFFKIAFLIIGISISIFFIWLFIGKAPQASEIIWGITFSQKQAELLGISWKENYLAILDELKAKDLKIIAYWDLIEPEPEKYFFDDLDFQIKEAQSREVKIILVLGRKVPRWPECHIPDWAKNLSQEEQEKRLLKYIEKIILRYKDLESIWAWQIENEPFFNFGECSEITEEFLKQEIKLVKLMDSKNRPVIISDSGSNRFWFKTAKLGDMVSISLYRKVWFKELNNYVKYPFPAVFYWRKYQIVKTIFGKEVFCGELQAEPWGAVLIHELSLEEQQKTMNPEQFQKNIEFAKETGFDKFYLWGAEWWYWLKTKQNQPQIWEEAKNLIKTSG
jgi:hypothetical protein